MRSWRNAVLSMLAALLAFVAWSNRFEPAASPYFHKNRYTGALCHRGVECWIPAAARPLPTEP
jgi:hypothetical protein